MNNTEFKNNLDVARRRIFDLFRKERRHGISFRHAWDGLVFAFVSQPNFRIHVIIAATVVFAGVYVELSHIEWIVICFTIMTVLAAEMANTAIEQTIDLLTDKYHLKAKRAKDVAAGTVLLAVTLSVVTGLIIFIPHVADLFASR